jgi:hypothetical protein
MQLVEGGIKKEFNIIFLVFKVVQIKFRIVERIIAFLW